MTEGPPLSRIPAMRVAALGSLKQPQLFTCDTQLRTEDHMTYIIEAFSWGNDLVAPDIERCHGADLEEAKKEMNRQWENPKCFHVRVLSLLDAAHRFEHDLHCMKSRPTKDRELRLFFEKIAAPQGVKTIHRDEKVNVLRVRNFLFAVPVGCLHLPADKFHYDVDGTGMHEIEPQGPSAGSNALQLGNFETCIAAAAFIPSRMDALLVTDDDYWYFLSEVDIKERKAELSFSTMEVGRDFIQ
jgi:hypothetical protein